MRLVEWLKRVFRVKKTSLDASSDPFAQAATSRPLEPEKKCETIEALFERLMNEMAAERGASWSHAAIAGVSHKNSNRTSRQKYIPELSILQELRLEREPANQYSSWAVKISDDEGHQLGYVPDWLARDVDRAIQTGGYAACFVQSVGISDGGKWGASIAVLWREKLSPRNEFRRKLEINLLIEEWFWVKLSGMHKQDCQDRLTRLSPDERLTFGWDGDFYATSTKLFLCNSQEQRIATITKQQASRMLAAMADGAIYEAMLFELRPRKDGTGLEPVVAIARLKHTADA